MKHLLSKVDKLIIGGGMANTFLMSHGVDVGKSLAEPEMLDTAREIMTEAKTRRLRRGAARGRRHRARVQERRCQRHRADPGRAQRAMILDVGTEVRSRTWRL